MASKEWVLSTDGNYFDGDYETKEAAIAAGHGLDDYPFWVGMKSHPEPPEELWRAEDFVEHVLCQDEYDSDYNDFEIPASLAAELEGIVQKAIGEFLDAHKLRPTFWVVRCEDMTQINKPKE